MKENNIILIELDEYSKDHVFSLQEKLMQAKLAYSKMTINNQQKLAVLTYNVKRLSDIIKNLKIEFDKEILYNKIKNKKKEWFKMSLEKTEETELEVIEEIVEGNMEVEATITKLVLTSWVNELKTEQLVRFNNPHQPIVKIYYDYKTIKGELINGFQCVAYYKNPSTASTLGKIVFLQGALKAGKKIILKLNENGFYKIKF